MKSIYLLKYSVKGIKTIEEEVSLSFYKKTIDRNFNVKDYNIKGIYGMNGSGKTAIISSVEILKNILNNLDYLNNPMIQEKLNAIINKKLEELSISVEFVLKLENVFKVFHYDIRLGKNSIGKYVITKEKLNVRRNRAKNDSIETIFETKGGEISSIYKYETEESKFRLIESTKNLLSNTSLALLFLEKFNSDNKSEFSREFSNYFFALLTLGMNLQVYLDSEDNHEEYLIKSVFDNMKNNENLQEIMGYFFAMNVPNLSMITANNNIVKKEAYDIFEKDILRLYKFLHIFKKELEDIEIERKEDKEVYVCNLVMKYHDYKIDAEFESTGIKKLIKLFAYLNKMANGGIVFIDEFDSNLHDVYLCALLEYLMEYGEGQLCFTTHNVGPMDVLRRNKNSIDFLSIDYKIHSWKTNGNYSPSKLYRGGMIEGSPFNIDSIDFIGVLGNDEEDN